MNEVDEQAFDVEFLSCVIDKAKNMLVLDSDSHFSEYVGVHPSKIKQGKLFFHDILVPQEREKVMRQLCKKDSPYVYLDCNIKDKKGNFNFVHCTCRNVPDSTLCQITMADVSRSIKRSKELKAQAKEMNHLIDLVNGGVCLFKVNQDMHFEILYANEACCRYFGTTKENYNKQDYRIDELIHPEDKSIAFQAIGTAMATKKPIDLELRIITHKGQYIWCKMDAGIQRYSKDNCPVFHAVFSDITDVKEAESLAEHQRETLTQVLKNVPGPLFCTDYDNPFVLNVASEDFMKLTGYTRDELFIRYGGDLTNLISSREVDIARHAIDTQLEKGNVAKATYSLKIKGGKHLVVVDRRKVISSTNGEKSTIGLLKDITSMHLDEDFDI